ncbi:hypothetical protein FD754_001395, partial [Muntiacus muntjak]
IEYFMHFTQMENTKDLFKKIGDIKGTFHAKMNFIFLCSKITADGNCSHEIRRCLLLGRKAMTNLDSILKHRDITLPTKVHIIFAQPSLGTSQPAEGDAGPSLASPQPIHRSGPCPPEPHHCGQYRSPGRGRLEGGGGGSLGLFHPNIVKARDASMGPLSIRGTVLFKDIICCYQLTKMITALAEVNLKKKSYLNIRTHPVATSFAVFDDTLLIVDPTEEEEHLATGTLTVVMDEEGRLCCLHKPGGSGLTGSKLQDCMSRAVTRHKEVKKLMDEVFKSMKPK